MGFGYGMNENQNHLVCDGRTTSRVLSEPGGKSSIHLGWDSPKKSSEFAIEFSFASMLNTAHHLICHPTQSIARNTAVVNENQEEKENLMKVIGSTAPTVKPSVKVSQGGISSNAYAQGSRQNVGNVITDRTTSRVTQPPGGRSSISLF